MFIVRIDGVDSSSHTQEIDAKTQKERLVLSGTEENLIEIVESSEFNPPSRSI